MRRIETLSITTSGTDGSATGSATTPKPITGRVVAVHLDYSAGQPATTDVTITAMSPAVTVLAKANSVTDGWYYPHTAAHLAADGSVISGGAVVGVPVDGYISVAVAGADNGETVGVTLMVAED